MALDKSQILTEINSLLASGSNIEASEHRQTMYSIVDKVYDENIDGVSLSGTELIFTRNGGAGASIVVDLAPIIPDISGKADKVSGATAGNLATLDASGNLTDSLISENEISDNASAIITLQNNKADKNGETITNATLTTSTINGVYPTDAGAGNQFLSDDGSYKAPTGGGDVVGPNGAVNNGIALFDGTTGKLIKDSGVLATSKMDKVNGATSGNLAAFNGVGQVIDALVQISSFATKAQGDLADTAIQISAGLTQNTTGAPTYSAGKYTVLTAAEYGALTPDANTLYFIV